MFILRWSFLMLICHLPRLYSSFINFSLKKSIVLTIIVLINSLTFLVRELIKLIYLLLLTNKLFTKSVVKSLMYLEISLNNKFFVTIHRFYEKNIKSLQLSSKQRIMLSIAKKDRSI